jgi:four helix bundle protein
MSNIAEGFESRTDRLFADYLGRAKASAGEVRAQLHLAGRQGYLAEDARRQLISRVSSISRQIAGLIKYLDRSAASDSGSERSKRP